MKRERNAFYYYCSKCYEVKGWKEKIHYSRFACLEKIHRNIRESVEYILNVFHTIGTKTVPISHLTSKSQLSTPEKITLFSPSFRMDKLSHFSSKQLSIWPGRKLAIPSTVLPSILCPPSLHSSPYKYTFNRARKGGGSDGHLFENPWETSFLRCCSVLELRREEDCPDGLEGKGDHCLNWERG